MKKIISLWFLLAYASVWSSVGNQPQSSADEQALREYVSTRIQGVSLDQNTSAYIQNEKNLGEHFVFTRIIGSLKKKGVNNQEISALVKGLVLYRDLKLSKTHPDDSTTQIGFFWNTLVGQVTMLKIVKEKLYDHLVPLLRSDFEENQVRSALWVPFVDQEEKELKQIWQQYSLERKVKMLALQQLAK